MKANYDNHRLSQFIWAENVAWNFLLIYSRTYRRRNGRQLNFGRRSFRSTLSQTTLRRWETFWRLCIAIASINLPFEWEKFIIYQLDDDVLFHHTSDCLYRLRLSRTWRSCHVSPKTKHQKKSRVFIEPMQSVAISTIDVANQSKRWKHWYDGNKHIDFGPLWHSG